MYGGCKISKNSRTALSVRTNMETVRDPGMQRSPEGCFGAVPKQDGTTVCQTDRWRCPSLASILPVCTAAHGDMRCIYIDFSKSFLICMWGNRWLLCPHAREKSINTQILIACLYKRSIVCCLQQVYIFYINHLLKITDLEKSFCTVHYIWRITATRLLFIWISLYMSTVHIK